MTNILLITLLIVLISGLYLMYRFYKRITSDIHFNRTEIMTNYQTIKDIYPLVTFKTDAIKDEVKQSLDVMGDINDNLIDLLLRVNKLSQEITIDYKTRIEQSEKLIAELKQTQAPQEVTDTVNLINEWMNGAPVEKE